MVSSASRSSAAEPVSEAPGSLQELAHELAALGAETQTERTVKRVVPWIISLAIHAGVILLAFFITWTVTHLPKNDDAVLVVADFNAMNFESAAGLNTDSTDQGSASSLHDVLPSPDPQPSVTDQLRDAGNDPLRLIAEAGQAGHSGDNASAVLSSAAFAMQGTGNSATFGGVTGSNARKIVYVIDASGSMVPYLQIVIDELTRSLSNLSTRQSFAVMFFQGNNVVEVPPADHFTPATDQDRVAAIKWIKANVIPSSGTNPMVAIEKALSLKPDVVFLLSQDITGYGQFEVDQNDLLTLLNKLNPIDPATNRRATQINCIQFIDQDRLDTMRKIAEIHGGAKGYKFLSRQELGLAPK
jgi:hypothetical protein